MTERKLTRRDFLKAAAVVLSGAAVNSLLGGCIPSTDKKADDDSANQPVNQGKTPTAAPETPTAAPETPTAAPETPTAAPETPTAAPETPTAAPETPTEIKEEIATLPYFSVEGAPSLITLSFSDPRVANNGPDKDGNDHQNPFMPKSAAWLITADPGHYRVDNLANVTDPKVRESIERDIRNGAAFAGNDYKNVLLENKAIVPLWEAGGGAILTGAQMQINLVDAQGNPIVFQLGRQENHGWVAVIANGLDRDHVRGTDANRSLNLTKHDPGFTMWQGIPPGMFISTQYVCQTVADAHGSYRDRGTSPGQGQDGVERVSVLLVKILPEGIAYTVLQHNNPDKKWEDYRPDQFDILYNNTAITR